jgi:hypothetical protein
MRRLAFGSERHTWYEQLLRQINRADIDYGALWEQSKQDFIHQLGNPYFQYGLGATVAVVLLLVIVIVQRLSHRRSLEIATQSITDALRHDAYSRKVAEEAIQRYNDHIESCNRIIEMGQDRSAKAVLAKESELHRLREELADTRQENRSLRDELAKKTKESAGEATQAVSGADRKVQTESALEQYRARISALEKQLREEQRKNQQVKGTTVDDHRA